MENQMMIKLLHLLDNSYPGFTLVELLFIRVFLAGGMGHLTSLKSAYSPHPGNTPFPLSLNLYSLPPKFYSSTKEQF